MIWRLSRIRTTAASAITTGASNRATATTSSNASGPSPTVTAVESSPVGTGAVGVCVMGPLERRRAPQPTVERLIVSRMRDTWHTRTRAHRHHHRGVAGRRHALYRAGPTPERRWAHGGHRHPRAVPRDGRGPR